MNKSKETTATAGPVRLKVIRPGAAPPCLAAGQLPCRGCPGWIFMKQAAVEPGSVWGRYPLHCWATGLTVQGEQGED